MWSFLQQIGSLTSIVCVALLAIYIFPHSPLRKLIEEWIERKVAAPFERERDQFKQRLSLEAESVRADYQRKLHDFALYSTKKHEVYRELFRLILIADGSVAQLYGIRTSLDFEPLSLADVSIYLDGLKVFPSVKSGIIRIWDSHRNQAVQDLKALVRRIELERAEQAINEAWNFFLVNSLYLEDEMSRTSTEAFKALRGALACAQYPSPPESGKEFTALRQQTVGLLDQLKRLLRDDLYPPNK